MAEKHLLKFKSGYSHKRILKEASFDSIGFGVVGAICGILIQIVLFFLFEMKISSFVLISLNTLLFYVIAFIRFCITESKWIKGNTYYLYDDGIEQLNRNTASEAFLSFSVVTSVSFGTESLTDLRLYYPNDYLEIQNVPLQVCDEVLAIYRKAKKLQS